MLTVDNLRRGMQAWTSRRGWPRDFHATFYAELAGLKANGLTDSWWRSIVRHLSAWRANRPFSTAEITEQGLPMLGELTNGLNHIKFELSGRAPSLENCRWQCVQGLYDTAHSIKGVPSPVFGSKLCHFILPEIFPVIDGAFLGGASSYQQYWEGCRGEWMRCADPTPLMQELQHHVGSTPEFPWATKIIELCYAGHRQTMGCA